MGKLFVLAAAFFKKFSKPDNRFTTWGRMFKILTKRNVA